MLDIIKQYLNAIPDKRITKQLYQVLDRMLPSDRSKALTASTTQTQTGALQLPGDVCYHEVTTVGTAGDTVSLPFPTVGRVHIVTNAAAANSMQVYAATPGTIDSVATGTGVPQLAGDTVMYFCVSTGNYRRLGGVQTSEAFTTITASTVSMNDGGYVDFSNAVVAAAGSAQASYAQLADQINAVTTDTASKGVALPAASAGRAIFVVNTSQTLVLPVSPINSGNDQINSLTAGTGVFTMGPAQAAWFIPTSATQWYVTGDAAITGNPTEQDLGGLLATVAEINRAADVSTRIVSTTAASLAITLVGHDSKVVVLASTHTQTITLPAATGTGAKFKFVVSVTGTDGSKVIQRAGAGDNMTGVCIINSTATGSVDGFLTTATDNVITLNNTTSGGIMGTTVEIIDVAASLFLVSVVAAMSGTVTTPFSHGS